MTERSGSLTDQRLIGTLGPIRLSEVGITDAHNHLWIDPVPGAWEEAPVLNQMEVIREGLDAYRRAGGGAIVDCQPGGCGRNGLKLIQLAEESGVHVVACTGFHLRKYYPPGYWLFQSALDRAAEYFIDELTKALSETRTAQAPARAGFIKIACEATLQESPSKLMEAAAAAAQETGAAIAVHTERGASARAIARKMNRFGLRADRLVLCHMDKRPDAGLHRELADEGLLLAYDTFFRPKCEPETHVWPLLERLASDGYADKIALATDMAELDMWSTGEAGGRLVELITVIAPRLSSIGFNQEQVKGLLGGNINARLARPVEEKT